MIQALPSDPDVVVSTTEGTHPVGHFLVTVPNAHADSLTKSLTHAYPGASIRTVGGNRASALVAERGTARLSVRVCR